MTHFSRRKILDAISQIIADEGRKVGLFLPKKKHSKAGCQLILSKNIENFDKNLYQNTKELIYIIRKEE